MGAQSSNDTCVRTLVDLIAQSWATLMYADLLAEKLDAFKEAFREAIKDFIPQLSISFDFLIELIQKLDISINIRGAGVSCYGMQAPYVMRCRA